MAGNNKQEYKILYKKEGDTVTFSTCQNVTESEDEIDEQETELEEIEETRRLQG